MGIIAFTLGLLGSLHCIGMCGPLAIAFSEQKSTNAYQRFWEGLSYNLGRTVTYSLLGLLFGAVGSFLWVADLQKVLSISLGIFFVIAFLLATINAFTSIAINTISHYHDPFYTQSLAKRSLGGLVISNFTRCTRFRA